MKTAPQSNSESLVATEMLLFAVVIIQPIPKIAAKWELVDGELLCTECHCS